ncbi:hypothetical protein LS684_20235 [Cytobacillus spongiae]|uniref:hypothetical protein n=1 Tax=Cytobacillus spongiae TaxID=2901381 RepID=UPI001F41FDA9|nr:hypothetical protein [Cytobacillus spongiae]UII55918.1 hypothetical protein LS684_20235 [Cytobacillus spongiae]
MSHIKAEVGNTYHLGLDKQKVHKRTVVRIEYPLVYYISPTNPNPIGMFISRFESQIKGEVNEK